MKVRILGIDPALNNLGLVRALIDTDSMEVTVEDMNLVQTEASKHKTVRKNSDDLERASQLHVGMVEAAEGCALAIAEVPVGSQSARAMASYGICVGVLAGCPIPLIQVSPSEVKMAAIGYKNATKDEMIEWAMNRYPKAPWRLRKSKGAMVPMNDNEHLADALAAIEAGMKTDQFRQAVALWKSMKAA